MAEAPQFFARKCTKAHMDEIELKNGQIFFLLDTKDIYIDTEYNDEVQRMLVSSAPSYDKTIKGVLDVTGWSQSHPFTYTYKIHDEDKHITSDSVLSVDLDVNSAYTQGLIELENWEKISKIETIGDNWIYFYCYGNSRPVINLPFIAKEI